jgi:heat shock protein HspQ
MTALDSSRTARFKIGDVVKHRIYPFRGVVYDVDPVFNNTDEWLAAIPEEIRPHKDQPFYHLFAENDHTTYVAYVSEQNLLPDESGRPCRHPMVPEMFEGPKSGSYRLKAQRAN